MKLQIDTERKTISIEESINLGELYNMLTAMFPNFTWKEYEIVPVKIIEKFSNPITIPWSNPNPWVSPTPTAPWSPSYPIIYCGSTTDSVIASAGDSSSTTLGRKGDSVTPTLSTYNFIIKQ